MSTPQHFEELRRAAFDRGQSDYWRFKAQADGEPVFNNNPHQNNHATDEAAEWERGWQLAESDDALAEHKTEQDIKG